MSAITIDLCHKTGAAGWTSNGATMTKHERSNEVSASFASPKRAWLPLGSFALLLASTQVVWLSYAPVAPAVSVEFGVSEGDVGLLAVLMPIFLVLLGLPAGRWLDRRFGATMVVGIALTAAGALVKAIEYDNYTYALVGQLLCAIGFPLLVTATTKVPARFLPPEQRVLAISLVMGAQLLGILLSSATGPWLYGRGGLEVLVWTHAAFALIASAAMLGSLTIKPRPTDPAVVVPRINLLKNRQLWLLAGQVFVGMGLFNALVTWLESLQSGLGNPGLGGPMVSLMTIAGIAGAAIVPSIVVARNKRRTALIAIAAGSLVMTSLMLITREPVILLLMSAVLGFILNSGLPIVFDWSERLVGKDNAGAAAAFILVIGNLGGVLYGMAVQILIGSPHLAILILTILVLPWILFARMQTSEATGANGTAESSVADIEVAPSESM